MPPLIQLVNVERHYQMGDECVRALDGVSVDIERGEYVSIVGSSGSGKTTLMHVLGCLDRPTAGVFRLADADVGELDDEQLSELRNREIGFVFQNFQLLPRATALSNVALPLMYRGVPRKRRNELAAEALERVGLADRMTHRPNQMSGGQRQRVSIARALVAEPSLLLADEPTGNLDSTTEREILALFDELHNAGNTIIIVTHEPSIAARCARAIRMADGLVVDDGPGAQVAGIISVRTVSKTSEAESDLA